MARAEMKSSLEKIIFDQVEKSLKHQECRRLFHGRGKAFEELDFLNIDWYPPVLLITLYRPSDLIASFVEALGPLLGECSVILQKRYLFKAPFELLKGQMPKEHFCQESGAKFYLRLGATQNIGFFPDMRAGREFVGLRAKGKRVLNLFAYTCSFSVVALLQGAESVVNVDMKRSFLEIGKKNHQLNGIDLARATFLDFNIVKNLKRLMRLGAFDLIIIDPPSRQGDSFVASRDYKKIVSVLDRLLTPEGEVLACLNSAELDHDYLMTLFRNHAPKLALQGIIPPAQEIVEKNPEQGIKLQHYA